MALKSSKVLRHPAKSLFGPEYLLQKAIETVSAEEGHSVGKLDRFSLFNRAMRVEGEKHVGVKNTLG